MVLKYCNYVGLIYAWIVSIKRQHSVYKLIFMIDLGFMQCFKLLWDNLPSLGCTLFNRLYSYSSILETTPCLWVVHALKMPPPTPAQAVVAQAGPDDMGHGKRLKKRWRRWTCNRRLGPGTFYQHYVISEDEREGRFGYIELNSEVCLP